MDIISHGFWGSIAFGRKSKQAFLIAFFFGIFPDLFAFAFTFIERIFFRGEFISGPISQIPRYVHTLYNISHSLVVALAVILICVAIWKSRAYVMFAWPLHILFDTVSHDLRFFPTPFIWPLNTPFFPGTAWSTPWVFVSNWTVLIALYALWVILKPATIKLKDEFKK